MKKIIVTATALVATAAFALTGCSGERGGGTDTGSGEAVSYTHLTLPTTPYV